MKFKRLINYSQLAITGGLSKVLPSQLGKKRLEKHTAEKMADLHGIPMKISQILSMGKENPISKVHQDALKNTEALPVEYIKEIIKPLSVSSFICEISEQGLPASLGQVHQVIGQDQKTYALKVQYPDINESINLDQELLNLTLHTFQQFKEGFQLSDYQKMIQLELQEELDFLTEAKKMQLFSDHFSNTSIIVPQPHLAYCQKNCLLMSWHEAIPLNEYLATANENQKESLTQQLVTFYLESLFQLNLIHADPNLGNFAVQVNDNNPQLVVFDFGSAYPILPETSALLLLLLKSVDEKQNNILEILIVLGFSQEGLLAIQENLTAFFDMLLEPFTAIMKYQLKDWNRKERAKDILGDHRWVFMTAAPAKLFPLMRATQGLFYYLNKIDHPVYFRKKWLDIFSQQKNQIDKIILPQITKKETTPMASFLEISVFENKQQKVNVKLPRNAIENLEDFMDDELMTKLTQDGISISEIVKKARQNGYRKMNLFTVENTTKLVRVSLVD